MIEADYRDALKRRALAPLAWLPPLTRRRVLGRAHSKTRLGWVGGLRQRREGDQAERDQQSENNFQATARFQRLSWNLD